MNLEGKNRRRGNTTGKTSAKKKAIVQLTEDSAEIEIFAVSVISSKQLMVFIRR